MPQKLAYCNLPVPCPLSTLNPLHQPGCRVQHIASEGVQCNGCLALMALVRGEGEASDANRQRLADCDGVQVIADGELAGG